MNVSIMIASFPLDLETFNEVRQLCNDAIKLDGKSYSIPLNLQLAQNENYKGFFVLAYDDENEALIGMISAIDFVGLYTYEWSMLVSPMYRKIGIEEALLSALSQAFQQRGAEGEMVVLLEDDDYGRNVIERHGYSYSFSEITLESMAEAMSLENEIIIRPYNEITDLESLIELFHEAFGDLREESIELIQFNTMNEGKIVWVAEIHGQVVGTVTSTKEGHIQWITALAVHSKLQGKGIGTALLNWIRDFAYRNGEKKVMLNVEIENKRALEVYEKAGFYKSLQLDYFIYHEE